MNREKELEIINKSDGDDIVLSDESKEKIYKIYEKDFLLFGYEK